MTSGGVKKLLDFLRQHDLLLVEAYCYEGYIRFVKVIHTNGVLFMIHIAKDYQLVIPEQLSMVTLKKVPVLDSSNHQPVSCEEYYTITLADGKRYVQNAKELLHTRYDQSIVLQTSNIIQALEQMKRIKACFKETFFKVLLEVDEYLLYLNSNQQIEILSTGRTVHQTFFIACELEYLYKNIKHVFDQVSTVQTKFFTVLDTVQRRHLEDVKNELLEDFVMVNQRCTYSKDKMKKTFQDASVLLKTTFEKEQELEQELKKVDQRDAGHPFRDMDRLGKKRVLEQDLRKLADIKQTVLDKVIGMDQNLKHVYLQIDALDYQVSLALMSTRNELEKILDA